MCWCWVFLGVQQKKSASSRAGEKKESAGASKKLFSVNQTIVCDNFSTIFGF
jgi:hypothetical protein